MANLLNCPVCRDIPFGIMASAPERIGNWFQSTISCGHCGFVAGRVQVPNGPHGISWFEEIWNKLVANLATKSRVRAHHLPAVGRIGILIHGPIIDLKGRSWMAVQWTDEDVPALFRTSGLEIELEDSTWEPMQES